MSVGGHAECGAKVGEVIGERWRGGWPFAAILRVGKRFEMELDGSDEVGTQEEKCDGDA